MTMHCAGCRAELAADDRFCTRCGQITRRHAEELHERVAARSRGERGRSVRTALAICIAFVVPTVLGILGAIQVQDPGSPSVTRGIVIVTTAEVLGIVAILSCLGRGSFAAAFATRTRATAWFAAPILGGAGFAVSAGWVWFLGRLANQGASDPGESAPRLLWVGAILLAPLLEEALCRGALWHAVQRVAGKPQTVVVTAAVFALLHMQNGGLLLELPHRFLVGLFLGWLRLHGGSVWPCMVAHAVLNTAAMLTSA